MNNVPYYYNYINEMNSNISPSTVHCSNNALHTFFSKYLFQRALSVFEFIIPDSWAKDYFLYTLFGNGFITVINTDKYGVIPQMCSLAGYDVFYRPNRVVIANPLLKYEGELRINRDCTLIRLQPCYSGVLDIVNFYADLMGLCVESLGINLLNSHLSYAFAVGGKSEAETFKKIYDKITSGEPAVFYDKSLNMSDGKKPWEVFTQDIGSNYIVDRLLSDLQKIVKMFDTEIGIPNSNTDKKERLISDEVNSNNIETRSKVDLWLEFLQKGCKETNNMFGTNLSVKLRYESEV